MSSQDRDTNPDGVSPYEFILLELNTIKALCQETNAACTSRIVNAERLAAFSALASLVSFLVAACAFQR